MLTGQRAFEDDIVNDTIAPVLPGALGEIAVSRPGTATVFDFRELNSEVASRRNPDDSGVCHRHRLRNQRVRIRGRGGRASHVFDAK